LAPVEAERAKFRIDRHPTFGNEAYVPSHVSSDPWYMGIDTDEVADSQIRQEAGRLGGWRCLVAKPAAEMKGGLPGRLSA